MADKMIKMAGRGNDGKAKAIKTDDLGNIGTQLTTRNELVTFNTDTIAAKGSKSIVNRFDDLENYSAIVVAVSFSNSTSFRLAANWYIQKPEEQFGTQVTSDTILDTTTGQRYASGYLEIKGTQLSVVIANTSESEAEATVYIMGIR